MAYARDNPSEDILWMLYAWRQLLKIIIQRPEAENIGTCYGISPNPQDIPYHASCASSRTPKRLYRRRMVMRLHLHRYAVIALKIYYACIILEDRDAPRLLQLVSCLRYVCLQEASYFLAFGRPHNPLEGLVITVLRPCLTYCLQFDIRRVSTPLRKVAFHSPHFFKV